MFHWIFTVLLLSLGLNSGALAASSVEGSWQTLDGQTRIQISEFKGTWTFHTRSYYSNGAPSDYFFELSGSGDEYAGHLRSVDGYYGCLFDENAEALLTPEGHLKIHYPLLTFHRRTRSVQEDGGVSYQHRVDWTEWGWVESIRSFPLEHWRVISSECVIDQTNWTTVELIPDSHFNVETY